MNWQECPTLELALETRADRRAAAIPESLAVPARALLAAVSAGIPPRYRFLADLARVRTGGRFQPELNGYAERLKVGWRDLMLANVSYDLLLATLGCSTVALATPAGPVLARNMDWWPEDLLAQASVATSWSRAGRVSFAAAGWPGAVGVVSGLSARGFGLALNAVSTLEKPDPLGYPMLLFLRRVIEEAGNFAEALEMLRGARLASPGMITLVGRSNEERAVIERGPRQVAVRSPNGADPLVTTNAYQVLECGRGEVRSLVGTACQRYDALRRSALASGSEEREIGDAELLYWLTAGDVAQSITAQHVIIRPAAGSTGTLRLYVPKRLLATEQ